MLCFIQLCYVLFNQLFSDKETTRSYTPIPAKYIPNTLVTEQSALLLVKSYENGNVSKYLTELNPLPSSLKLSLPKGNLSLEKLKLHTRIGVLAAGSGITPILSVLDYLTTRHSNKM